MSNFEKEAELNRLNDMIEKYERALRIAGDDIVEAGEGPCNVCRKIYSCRRKSMTDLACKKIFIESWKEEVGIK